MRMAVWLVLGIAALPRGAAAQPVTTWDAGASFGLTGGAGVEISRGLYGGEPNAAYTIDLGRYWTTHVKTDIGALLTPELHLYDYTPVALGGAVGGYASNERDRRLYALSAAATYQFFENQMMHPYVSGGLQVAFIEEHVYRDEQIVTVNRMPFGVPALDSRSLATRVRPFGAIGCKSYFNERTFIRSELAIAASARGFSHATLRLGFGVDF